MKAVIVSVNYSDYLSWTLPVSRPHFEEIVVVTDMRDTATVDVAREHGASVVQTDVFTRGGATFAKYDGIEAGLDAIGREGWITLLDADILLPKVWAGRDELVPGKLYGPIRRMCKDCPPPAETEWGRYPLDEWIVRGKIYPPRDWWLGYMHVFHASDPHLGDVPWHGSGHRTAARGDMVLFQKWPLEQRVRLPFEVLHLGEERKNWKGRVTGRYGR